MKALRNIRVVCHQLAEAQFEHPGEVVQWMGAMQAQEYRASKWAIGLRMKEGSREKVNNALRTGEIVRTHVMRPTWHYVAGSDLRWMLKLSGQRIRKTVDQWTKSSGVDVPESLYTKCNDLFVKWLSGGHSLTKQELTERFEQAGIEANENHVRRYLLRAEVEGIICSGEDRMEKPTYALLEEHLAPVAELSHEEALAELAVRYFRSHAPATLKDFIWWSGLSATEAKQAVALISDQLTKESYMEQEFLLHTSCCACKQKEKLHFLPPFDEYLIGYKERQTVMDPAHFPKAFNRWGIFYPVICYNGQIVGNWERAVKRGELTVKVSFFDSDSLQTVSRRALQRAEDSLKAWMT